MAQAEVGKSMSNNVVRLSPAFLGRKISKFILCNLGKIEHYCRANQE